MSTGAAAAFSASSDVVLLVDAAVLLPTAAEAALAGAPSAAKPALTPAALT